MDLLERLQKQKRSQYIGIRFTYFIEKWMNIWEFYMNTI